VVRKRFAGEDRLGQVGLERLDVGARLDQAEVNSAPASVSSVTVTSITPAVRSSGSPSSEVSVSVISSGVTGKGPASAGALDSDAPVDVSSGGVVVASAI